MNYRQIKAIEQKNQERLVDHFGFIPCTSGIYILTRNENGFKYAYIGQAKNLLKRLAEHLKASCGIFDKSTQHIDNSIRKHGLFSIENLTGWSVVYMKYPEYQLDEKEQKYIKDFANSGYQLYNHTTGSQGSGKKVLGDLKERKGYNQGLHNGYIKAIKEVRNYFDKYLDFVIKGKTNKTKERKFEEFKRWVYEETSKGDC